MIRYCRIDAGVIVEWNVTREQIKNRGHNIADYVPTKQSPPPPNARYEYVVEIEPVLDANGVPVQQFEVRQFSLDEFKSQKIKRLKELTEEKLNSRTVVDTPLGFPVDGGYKELANLKAGRDLGLTIVKDANNVIQTIDPTVGDWDTIINAVQQAGFDILNNKWTIEDQINAITVDGVTYVTELDALKAVDAISYGLVEPPPPSLNDPFV